MYRSTTASTANHQRQTDEHQQQSVLRDAAQIRLQQQSLQQLTTTTATTPRKEIPIREHGQLHQRRYERSIDEPPEFETTIFYQ